MEKELDEGANEPWRHRGNLCVPENVCAGWQTLTSTRDGIPRQH
jgi:hypothetical protein